MGVAWPPRGRVTADLPGSLSARLLPPRRPNPSLLYCQCECFLVEAVWERVFGRCRTLRKPAHVAYMIISDPHPLTHQHTHTHTDTHTHTHTNTRKHVKELTKRRPLPPSSAPRVSSPPPGSLPRLAACVLYFSGSQRRARRVRGHLCVSVCVRVCVCVCVGLLSGPLCVPARPRVGQAEASVAHLIPSPARTVVLHPELVFIAGTARNA